VVPSDRPVRELVYDPDAVPSSVTKFAIVGLEEVFQQVPLRIIGPPPSDVTFPPLEAVVPVTELAAVVVTAPNTGDAGLPHNVDHVEPLYNWSSPEVPQLLHQTICPVNGVAMAVRCA